MSSCHLALAESQLTDSRASSRVTSLISLKLFCNFHLSLHAASAPKLAIWIFGLKVLRSSAFWTTGGDVFGCFGGSAIDPLIGGGSIRCLVDDLASSASSLDSCSSFIFMSSLSSFRLHLGFRPLSSSVLFSNLFHLPLLPALLALTLPPLLLALALLVGCCMWATSVGAWIVRPSPWRSALGVRRTLALWIAYCISLHPRILSCTLCDPVISTKFSCPNPSSVTGK